MRAEKFDQLLADLQAAPATPAGHHLTDEEYVAFVLEETTPEQEARIASHLATCRDCIQDLDAFFAAAATFPQAEWAKLRPTFVRQLRARFQEEGLLAPAVASPARELLERLRAFLASVAYPLAFAPQFGTPREPCDYESQDGRFGVFVEDVGGNMTVHADAQGTELEGMTMRFSAGAWQRDVRLERVTDDQVGAKVVVTHDEREVLPKDAVLHVRLVGDTPDTDQTVS